MSTRYFFHKFPSLLYTSRRVCVSYEWEHAVLHFWVCSNYSRQILHFFGTFFSTSLTLTSFAQLSSLRGWCRNKSVDWSARQIRRQQKTKSDVNLNKGSFNIQSPVLIVKHVHVYRFVGPAHTHCRRHRRMIKKSWFAFHKHPKLKIRSEILSEMSWKIVTGF